MGDRCSVTITFGGRIPSSAIPALVELVRAYDEVGSTLDDDDVPVRGEPVVLTDFSANYASTEDVDAFCVEHGLTWVRRHGPGDEYGASIEWGVGDQEYKSLPIGGGKDGPDGDAGPLVAIADLAALLDRCANANQLWHVFGAFVAEHTPDEVPPLVVVPGVGDSVMLASHEEEGEKVELEATVLRIMSGDPDAADPVDREATYWLTLKTPSGQHDQVQAPEHHVRWLRSPSGAAVRS